MRTQNSLQEVTDYDFFNQIYFQNPGPDPNDPPPDPIPDDPPEDPDANPKPDPPGRVYN